MSKQAESSNAGSGPTRPERMRQRNRELPRGPSLLPADVSLAIVYTDIGGSTALTEAIGEAAAHRLLQEHNSRVRVCVARNGGYELKMLGDGFQLAFESAQAAVVCAIQVQNEVAALARSREGPPLAIRIGIHEGLPVREDEEVMGRAAILAQRVMASAQPGEILLSSETTKRLQRIPGTRMVERGLYRLKGIRESVALSEVIWRAEDVVEKPVRRPRISRAAPEGPFVGRQEALAALEEMLQEAASGRALFVSLEGEAGIGKTRLVEELLLRVHRRRIVLAEGRAQPFGGSPLGPLLDLLRPVLAAGDSEGPDVPSSRQVVAGALVQTPTNPLLAAAAARGEDPDLRRRAVETLADLLIARTRDRTHVLFLDDVHWADEDTVYFLSILGQRLARSQSGSGKLLVLLTCQPDELRRARPLRELLADLERCRLLVRFPVGGLGEADARALLRSLSSAGRDGEVIDLLLARGQGNPFFLLELARELEEGSPSTPQRDRVRPGDLDVPRRVQEVIERRLGRLTPECLDVLRGAALLAEPVRLDVLCTALGQPEEMTLGLLEEALEAGILREMPTGEDVAYVIEHGLLAECLAAQLSIGRRRRVHLALARALVRFHAPATTEQVCEIAHHLLRAGRIAPAPEVLRFAEEAGDAARALSALAASAHFYAGALSALSRCDDIPLDREAILRTKLCECLGALGKTEEARSLADAALAHFDGSGDRRRATETRLLISSLLASHAGYAEALPYLEEAAAGAPHPLDRLHGVVLARLAVALDQTGRGYDMRLAARRLRALARRLQDPELEERSLNIERNRIQNHTRHFDRLVALTGRLAEMAEARGDRWFPLIYQNEIGFFHFLMGDIEASLKVTDRALDHAIAASRSAEILNARALRALGFCYRGEWDRVEEEWSAAAPLLARVRGALRVGLLFWARRRTDMWLGRPTPRAPSPARIYKGMGSAAIAVDASRTLLDSEQEPARTLRQLEALSQVVTTHGAGLNWFIAAQGIAAAWANLGRPSQAASWYAALLPYRRTFYLGCTALDLGRIAGLNEWWDDSARLLGLAMRAARRSALSPFQALTLLERGRLYAAREGQGDRERARASLDEAGERFERLGMTDSVSAVEQVRVGL